MSTTEPRERFYEPAGQTARPRFGALHAALDGAFDGSGTPRSEPSSSHSTSALPLTRVQEHRIVVDPFIRQPHLTSVAARGYSSD